MKKIIMMLLAIVQTTLIKVNAQEVSQIKSDISEQARQEILQLNNEMETSFQSTDLLKISEYFDNDATIMISGRQIKGRKELSEFWSNIKDRKDFKLNTKEIGGSGKYIYQTGIVTWVASGMQVTKSFMMVWKRLSNYEYKIYLTGFN